MHNVFGGGSGSAHAAEAPRPLMVVPHPIAPAQRGTDQRDRVVATHG
jgi:hypothetical protein